MTWLWRKCQTQDFMEPKAHKTNCRDNENRIPMKAQEVIQSHSGALLKKAFLKISSLGDTFASSSRSNSLLVHATSRNRIFLWSLHWPLQHFDPWPQALFESLDSGCSERWKTRTWPRHTVSEDLSGVCWRNFVLMKKKLDDFR